MVSSEEEDEEYLVHVEFDAMLESDIFNRPGVFFKVIGVDSEKPIMQIEDQVYVGEYRDTAGTSLFFEEDLHPARQDPVFGKNAEKPLRYVCKTRKSLIMRRVFVKKSDPHRGTKREEEEELTDDDENPPDVIDNVLSSEEVGGKNKDSTMRAEVCEVKNRQSKCGNEDSALRKEDQLTRNNITQPKLSPQREVEIVPDSLKATEPVAGPSWAPDMSPADCIGDFKDSSDKNMSADEMSRLIAEQMTLESDINMQKSLCNSNGV